MRHLCQTRHGIGTFVLGLGEGTAAQLMQVCVANGMGDLDHCALVRALELMAAHQVAEG